MPARKRKKRAAKSRKAARKRKTVVKVSYGYKRAGRAPDRHVGTKRALAYIIFAVALAIGVTAFYDAAYYSAYVVAPAGPTYTMMLADGSGGSSSSDNFNLAVSMGEAIVGEAGSDGCTLTLGGMAFLGGDTSPPDCTIEQSTGTPALGTMVMLTAVCTDDMGLEEIALYTDESGVMSKISDYGSPASVSGVEADATFVWTNAEIGTGTTVTWKVVAKDTSGNEGESTTLAFTVGGPPDLVEPTIGIPVATPGTPGEGAEVTITAELSDNIDLASADLLVNGEVVDSITLTGTSATAEFTWTAGAIGTYTLKVTATDAAGNSAESALVSMNVVSAVCDPETKPDDTFGECVDGLQTVTTYVCDPTTGTWAPIESIEECAALPPIAFIGIGVIALAVALAAALYILKKKPAAPKGKKKGTPPATFG